MYHIVNNCPLTKFDSGLQELNRAGADAFEWLSSEHRPSLAHCCQSLCLV